MSSNAFEIRVGLYRLGRRIGSGSFGQIYEGHHVETDELVAIKLESVTTKHPQLAWEYKIYSLLQGEVGFPRIRWYTRENEHAVLVMDRLGHSLEDLMNQCGGKFTLPTVLMLAEQILARLEQLHRVGYIHRDIKPDNFLTGDKRTLYLIDLGLAKRYIKDGVHIPFADGKSLIGTARYASVNNHRGVEQCRKDDLEAVGYMLVYLVKGQLPWQGIKSTSKTSKYLLIEQCKAETTLDALCHGLPFEFVHYFTLVKACGFEETPNYQRLRKCFRSVMMRRGYTYDHPYDWENAQENVRS